MTQGRLPNLIIAGVGKAGTTSLFWYLSQHPNICASKVKEIRYFLPLAEGDGGVLPPLEDYAKHFKHCGTEAFRLEASPQYFHGGKPIIDAIKRTLDHPRIILVLRDPVQRLWSTYRFVKSRMGPLPTSLTFDEYVARCQKVREERQPLSRENGPYWTLSGGFYVEHIDQWLDAFGEDMRVLFFENMVEDPPFVVGEVCRWLGIDDRCVHSFNYSQENKTIEFRSKTLQRLALVLNSERLLGSRRALKDPLRRAYYAVNKKPRQERMVEATRLRLQHLLKDGNAALGADLRRRGYTDLPAWLNAS